MRPLQLYHFKKAPPKIKGGALMMNYRSGWYSLQVHFFHFRPLPQAL